MRQWLRETESDEESVLGVVDEDAIEEDYVENCDNDSNESNSENMDNTLHREYYIGRDISSRWYLEPLEPRNACPQQHNITTLDRLGPQVEGKNITTHLKSLVLLNTEIIQKIVDITNL